MWSSDGLSKSGWGQPSAIVNVGCCYHLLTEDDDRGKVGSDGRSAPSSSHALACGNSGKESEDARDEEEDGFPLSRRVTSLGLSLGIGARMLACQAVERWPTKGEVESSNLGSRATASDSHGTGGHCDNKEQKTSQHPQDPPVAQGDGLSHKLGEADLMFRKHFYRGVLQSVLEERFANQRPAGDRAGTGASMSKGKKAGTGGPPLETMAGNREVGWVVGAQKKLVAVAPAASAIETSSRIDLPNDTAGSRAASGDGVVTGACATVESPPSETQTDSADKLGAQETSHRVQGKGKSWDQVVNSKVRSGSFASYAAAALQRLGLDLATSSGVTEAVLEQYERRHSHRRQQIAVRSSRSYCHLCYMLITP